MPRFRYTLNTSTIRPTPLDEKIRVASRAGFQGIEPWHDEIDQYLREHPDESLDTLRKRIDDAGLRVESTIALGGWIDANAGVELESVLAECRRRIEQAAVLGSLRIVASPPLGPVERSHAASRFALLAAIGKAYDITPSMEFLGFTQGVHTLNQAWSIAAESGVETPFIVADVYHLLRGGGSIDDLLTISGHQISIFHINDLPAAPAFGEQTDHDRVMLEEGVVDLKRVIQNLRAIDYTGPLSLELFNRALWDQDPLEVARRGIDQLRRLAEQ
jgi:sugar phosphate isomerase/epimerase